MRGSNLFTLLVTVALVGAIHAQTNPEKEKAPPASVEKLIEQLGDENYEVRDRAARKLVSMGPTALPGLRKALDHPDAEVRKRLAEMVPAMETAAILSPKLVSLSEEKRTLKQTLDELGRQTGYKVEFWGGNQDREYSFSFRNKPLWQALDAICDASGMVVQGTYSEEAIRLQTQDCRVPHVCYDGSFRIVATGFQHFKNNNFGQLPRNNPAPQRNDSLTLNLMIYAEPKLPIMSFGQAVISSAYDENKVSMNPDGAERNPNNPGIARSFYRGGGYRMFSTQTGVNLLPPADSTRTVKYVKGNIPVTLLTAQKAEVLTSEVLKAKGKKFEAGAITFAFEDVSELPGSRLQLKLHITNADSKNNPNDFTWQNSIFQRIEVQDEKGNKFTHNGSSWGGNGPGQLSITLTYAPPANVKAGPAAKFVFQKWTTLQSSLTFEFKDLPLP